MSIKRIIFSSTRGWNPGDEFILFGIERLLLLAGVKFAKILFNRHPAIRTAFRSPDALLRIASFLFADKPDIQLHHRRRGKKSFYFDNSFSPTGIRIADYIIFAGTPEWAGSRNRELYSYGLRHHIPGALLGVGLANSIGDDEHSYLSEMCELITTRDDRAQKQLAKYGAVRAVCPALFAAVECTPVKKIKNIGIIFQGTRLWANSIPQMLLQKLLPIYRKILERYDSTIICHHFSDYVEANEIFGADKPILYSSDSRQLLNYLGKFSLVIGTRLHGIGAAASFGIPGILIPHDDRTAGSGSFREIISPPDNVMDLIAQTDWKVKSQEIISHRKKWEALMVKMIKKTSLV